MKRSLAPSQIRQPKSGSGNMAGPTSDPGPVGDTTTIQTMPLFGFLSIPDSMKRQFKMPTGCRITEASLALRKVKTLGGRKSFEPLRPSGVPQFKRVSLLLDSSVEEEDLQREGVAPELLPFEPLVLWEAADGSGHKIEVIPELACKLRPHQREGVQFLFECTMGLRGFEGEGCILADDMGLGKTLMSITLLWTLLNQGMSATASAVRKAVVVCPTSLVGNWENELRRWVGPHCPTFAVKSEPKKCIRNFVQHRGKGILIVSYETQRRYCKMFTGGAALGQSSACELLICDEAHKLKNASSGLAVSLNTLPAKKRILLSGTPMQNELAEFFNMVNFCNPGVLGSHAQFRKRYERPILQSRERGASAHAIATAAHLQKELSTIVNEFILKRGNILNAQHLPPKLVQYVCCELTPLQDAMYDKLLSSKECRHILDGRNSNALNTIRYMINICSHPDMIVSAHKAKVKAREIDDTLMELADVVDLFEGGGSRPPATGPVGPLGTSALLDPSRSERCNSRGSISNRFPINKGGGSGRQKFRPELSGKFYVLYRLMETLRAMRQGDRIVIVSNFTSTLDLVEAMCEDNGWPQMRLDGSTMAAKRTKLVDTFNDPTSNAFAFLLSSKAGGCGINLIGGNRLVLFDPDWNPASDKQAAARIWREGQKKRCFIYRFMSTSSIEEKIIQRQLSKEGLTSIVDNKEQVNTFSSKELKTLFRRRKGTRSDTHDTLRCTRCKGMVELGAHSEATIPPAVIDRCVTFLNQYTSYIEGEATALAIPPRDLSDIISICDELRQGAFSTLPEFSRKLRNIIRGVSDVEADCGLTFNIYEEFVARWTELVPELSSLASSSAAGTDENDDDNEGEECVEQDGCPEEEDFNRWSHHYSVRTCDDEALRRAMGDDTSVSFVFGLEVNWSLLQARQLERQEQEEAHRIQLRRDLEELNKRRRRDKAVLAGENESGSGCSEFEDVPIVASKIKKRGGGKAEPKPVRSDDTSSITNGVYSEADASMGAFIASSDSEEAEMDSEEDFASVPNTVSATGQCVAEESDEAEMSDRGEERTMLASFKGPLRSNPPVIDTTRRRPLISIEGAPSSTTKRPKINQSCDEPTPLRDVSNTAPVMHAWEPQVSSRNSEKSSSQSSENVGVVKTRFVEWDCALCTYHNSKRATKCQMCDTKK